MLVVVSTEEDAGENGDCRGEEGGRTTGEKSIDCGFRNKVSSGISWKRREYIVSFPVRKSALEMDSREDDPVWLDGDDETDTWDELCGVLTI